MKVRSPHCIILICILISSQPLFAEESENSETRYYRHEVNVSRTGMFLPTSQWKDYEAMVYKTLSIERHDGGINWFGGPYYSSSGTLFSYYYHIISVPLKWDEF